MDPQQTLHTVTIKRIQTSFILVKSPTLLVMTTSMHKRNGSEVFGINFGYQLCVQTLNGRNISDTIFYCQLPEFLQCCKY